MITLKEAIKIAKESWTFGLMVDDDGYTEIVDIYIGPNDHGLDPEYYGFDANLSPDEDFRTGMLCVSKKTGKVEWIGGGFLYAYYDMTNVLKEPI